MTSTIKLELKEGPNEKRFIFGLDAGKNWVTSHIGPMDMIHYLTNIRVMQVDEDSAYLTAYAMVQHCPPGRGRECHGPKYKTSREYFVNLVRDGEVLKIMRFVVDVIWREGIVLVCSLGVLEG
jgi:SnoaL-like domain